MADKKCGKKNRKFYLIDYENVNRSGLDGIEMLRKNDTVIIFYSKHADTLSFQLHEKLNDTKADITYFDVDTVGKNALDFQLASYIGYIVGKYEGSTCYIISHDAGFANVCNFWRKKGVKISIFPDISRSATAREVKKSDIKLILADLGLESEDENFVKNLLIENINRYDASLPQIKGSINTELCKRFGSEKTRDIYSAIKGLIR